MIAFARIQSLRARVQAGLFAGLLLASALLLWGSGQALRQTGEAVMLSRMRHDAESLVGALQANAQGWHLDPSRITGVYEQPYSGHYWQVSVDGESQPLASRSLWDQALEFPTLAPGEAWIGRMPGPNQQLLIVHAAGFNKLDRNLTLAVAEDLQPVQTQIRRFQRWSAAVLVSIAIGLLVLQHVLLRLSFARVSELGKGVDALRQGRRERLDEDLPSEVRPLAVEVNRLLAQMQQRLTHSRNALGNLAHALKAPVSVLIQDLERGVQRQEPGAEQSLRQAQRLRDLIQRELRRARMATAGRPARAFRPRENGDDLLDSLRRLHRDRELSLELQVSGPDSVALDTEDMLELLGNLLDNACKWAARRVVCRIQVGAEFTMQVADDGEGVSPALIERLTERGLRVDESVEGSGLGLAIVKDLVHHYGGRLQFDTDPQLGGLRVGVSLPLPSAESG